MKEYVIKHTWAEFHTALRGYDIYAKDFKQMKWFVFFTEDNDEIDRILKRRSFKFTVKKRQEWHDVYNSGLTQGVVN